MGEMVKFDEEETFYKVTTKTRFSSWNNKNRIFSMEQQKYDSVIKQLNYDFRHKTTKMGFSRRTKITFILHWNNINKK